MAMVLSTRPMPKQVSGYTAAVSSIVLIHVCACMFDMRAHTALTRRCCKGASTTQVSAMRGSRALLTSAALLQRLQQGCRGCASRASQSASLLQRVLAVHISFGDVLSMKPTMPSERA